MSHRRSTIQVESSPPGRVRLSPELNGKTQLTIDETDGGVAIEIPEEATVTNLKMTKK